jgi:hypothetical protein
MAKIIQLPKRDVIKSLLDANHQVRGGDNKNFLEEEYVYLNNRENILKKQITIVQLLSDNNIKLFDEIKNIESNKIKILPLADKSNVFYSALNFLPKPPNDKNNVLPLFEKEKDRLQYINNLTNQELHKHYQDQINNLNLELKYIQNIIKTLKESSSNNNTPKFKTIPTYNGLNNTLSKTQKELIAPFYKKDKTENERKILQEILLNHVKKDNDFTNDQKIEIAQYIINKEYDKAFDNYLMFPLTRDEQRILRALREEMYEQIKIGKITGMGQTSYEAYILYNKFFTIYGVSKDNKTRKPIKDILFGRTTKGLHKNILLEHENLVTTSLILQVQEIKEKTNLSKENLGTGFIITMPSFLFVNEDKLKAKNYYNQENEGYRRFMKTGRMAQSDAATKIACKLEVLCHCTINNKKRKGKKVLLDLETLVKIAGYERRYQRKPSETINKIKIILDSLVEANYLIEEWCIKEGKFRQKQYIFKPLKIPLSQ